MNRRSLMAAVIVIVLGMMGFVLLSKPPIANGPAINEEEEHSATTTPGFPEEHNDPIILDTPLSDTIVTSPLIITGKAPSSWYFEASFGVELTDATGKQLLMVPATAQGEWMIEGDVPFKAILTFPTPSTPTGYVVFHKDNPSGLPQHDQEFKVPVRFSTAGDMHVKLYFYKYELDHSMCSEAGLVAADRVITKTMTPLTASITLLLQQYPTPADGLVSELPNTGVTLKHATIENGVASLTFDDPRNQTSGGSCRVLTMRNQIEATAKQFSSVTSVKILPETLFQP